MATDVPGAHSADAYFSKRPAYRRLRRLLKGNWLYTSAIAFLVVIVLAAVLASVLPLADPDQQALVRRLRPPLWAAEGGVQNPLGTDAFGRDVLSRIVWAGRVSLLVASGAVVVSGLLGLSLGLVAGYEGGRLEAVIMRIGDVQMAFPSILLAIAFVAVFGSGVVNLILILGFSGWVTCARVVRAETLSLKQREFVAAARSLGAPRHHVLMRHILPNVVGSVAVVLTMQAASYVLTEAALSFLGLGIPTEIPSWGSMLSEAQSVMTRAPWLTVLPGTLIALTVLSLNLVGDFIRDLLDPRSAER